MPAPETPTVPLDVRACRDCRFCVPGVLAESVEDEDFARCTAPAAAALGKPLYHRAVAEAPLCSAMREGETCGPDAKLFEAAPASDPP